MTRIPITEFLKIVTDALPVQSHLQPAPPASSLALIDDHSGAYLLDLTTEYFILAG